MRFLRLPAAALAVALFAPAQDELGLGKMWTFERPPLAYLEREYGFEPDERWWNTVRLASLRFGRGCSASFVSPRGLILTNHHCARGAIAGVQGDFDWVRDGFVAREPADEVRLPGLTVQQLVRMTDVTAEMTEGIRPDADPERVAARLEQNGERVLARSRQKRPELSPQLVKLFQGAIWQLYEYRVFDDVRLVMAPHLAISHFGGDPDNFVYPRYAIDFAFCRAYVDGEPADTSDFYLPWSDGPEQGELVLLTGNPGGTQRLLTKAQLEYRRDVRYPRIRELIDNRIAILRELAARDAEQEKSLRTMILGLENGQKLYRGEHGALLDPAFMQRKEAAERAFQSRALESGKGDARLWDRISKVTERRQALEGPLSFHTAGGLPLLQRALAVLEFAESGNPKVAERARAIDCAPDPVRLAFFADHWDRARDWLPEDDPVLRIVLDRFEPAQAAERLQRESHLADPQYLEILLADEGAAVGQSGDLALVIARVLRRAMEQNRIARDAITAEEDQLGARIAGLLFDVYGNDVSPDATFTLRFSDGRVLGYPFNGTLAPWRTSFHGLFARHAEFDGVHPFDLPEEWLLAKDRIDMQAAVDFVCTVDSTGGNSGSPVINRRGELVGLLFDGNIESLANEFLYGERVERSICVHPQGIVEALRKVYRASRLLREIAR